MKAMLLQIGIILSSSCFFTAFAAATDVKACRDIDHHEPAIQLAAQHLCIKSDASDQTRLKAWRSLWAKHPDYPMRRALDRDMEKILAQYATPEELKAVFTGMEPQTEESLMALMRSYLGQTTERAAMALRTYWRGGHELDQKTFQTWVKKTGARIWREDHLHRFRKLAAKRAYAQAKSLIPLLEKSCRKDALAYLECRSGKGSCAPRNKVCLRADFVLQQAYTFDKQNDFSSLAALLLLEQKSLPGSWSPNHGSLPLILARSLIEAKKTDAALAFTAAGARYRHDDPEAIWLYGYTLLRLAQRPQKAAEIFSFFTSKVSSPISRARGYYWAALAYEKASQSRQANDILQKCAQEWSTFYGQECGRKLGLRSLPITDDRRHASSPPQLPFLETATILHDRFDASTEALNLLATLTRTATAEDMDQLVERAFDAGGILYHVVTGRRLAFRNLVSRPLSFPRPELPLSNILPPALTYGIIRQESSFQEDARSRANALGLMQIIPSTGKQYGANRSRLLNPKTNIQVGSRYMQDLLERYDQNLILAMAAYNAGPSTVDQWIERFGSGNKDDMIDWIEMIPYGETRGYVQRIPAGARIYLGWENDEVPLVSVNELIHAR